LGHILDLSRLGATLNVDTLPIGSMLSLQSRDLQHRFALSGGDDYELCFTAASSQRDAILAAAQSAATPVTRVGTIEPTLGLRFIDDTGTTLNYSLTSFDHFTTP
jgi:thiamine-monophosphate kinase